MNDELELLRELGFTLPSPAYIVGAIVFGIVGLVAYHDGKRHARVRERWIGIALMLYPYVVGETWLLYLVGLGLCAAAWWTRTSAVLEQRADRSR